MSRYNDVNWKGENLRFGRQTHLKDRMSVRGISIRSKANLYAHACRG